MCLLPPLLLSKQTVKNMKRKIYSLLFVLFVFPAFVSAQTTENNSRIRQKTFEKVWQTVNGKYFDPNFGGVD